MLSLDIIRYKELKVWVCNDKLGKSLLCSNDHQHVENGEM